MADVRIVCVREDLPRAHAIAELLAKAGFSVGGPPDDEASLAACSAAVVIWSAPALRSRRFLDAGQRVINAGKAVFANLIEAPPAEVIHYAPSFDLTGWQGGADDRALAPLYYEVARMVRLCRNAAAYAVDPLGWMLAGPAEAAPPLGEPQPSAMDARLSREVRDWLAICEHAGESDLEAYLARYGPRGLFCGAAEAALRTLRDAARAPEAPAQPEGLRTEPNQPAAPPAEAPTAQRRVRLAARSARAAAPGAPLRRAALGVAAGCLAIAAAHLFGAPAPRLDPLRVSAPPPFADTLAAQAAGYSSPAPRKY